MSRPPMLAEDAAVIAWVDGATDALRRAKWHIPAGESDLRKLVDDLLKPGNFAVFGTPRPRHDDILAVGRVASGSVHSARGGGNGHRHRAQRRRR